MSPLGVLTDKNLNKPGPSYRLVIKNFPIQCVWKVVNVQAPVWQHAFLSNKRTPCVSLPLCFVQKAGRSSFCSTLKYCALLTLIPYLGHGMSFLDPGERVCFPCMLCHLRLGSLLHCNNIPSDRSRHPYDSAFALLSITWAPMLHKPCGATGCQTLLNMVTLG